MAEDGRSRDELLQENAELRGRLDECEVRSPACQRAAAELQDYQKCCPWIFDNIHDVFYRTDMEGRVVHVSRSVESAFGYTVDEVLHEYRLDDVWAFDEERQLFRQALREKGHVKDFEFRARRKDGSLAWATTSAAFYTDEGGKVLGVEGVAREVTERREAEERARQYARDLEYLNRTALGLVALPADRDIYQHIADRLKEIVGDLIVAVSSFDEKTGLLTCRATAGLGKFTQAVLKLVGRDPVGMTFPISPEAVEGLSKGCIVGVPGGFAELALGQIPDPVCRAMEKLLGIEAVHAIGIVGEGRLLGSMVVIRRRGTELLNRTTVETFAGQVSVALRHRASEEALLRSEAKYRAVVENTNDIVFAADGEGRLTYVSPQIERFGLNPEQALSMDVFEDFILPEDRERVVSDFQHTMATGEEFPTEFRARDRHGRVRWLEDLSKVRRDETGRIVGLTGILRDITERKEAEEALRGSEAKYRELVESMSEVIYAVDEKGVVTYVSPAVKAFIGREPSEVIGRPLSEFVYPEDLPRVRESIRDIVSGRLGQREYRVLTKAGEVRWLRASTRPVLEGDRLVGLRGILVDITEQRLLENRILEASTNEQRRIGQDLHDGLGQELAAVAFMARTIEQKLEAKSPDEARDVARMGGMIDKTVAHTRDLVGILNPVGPERDGLMGALENLAAGISSVYGVPCVFEPEAAVPVEDNTAATHVFRIAQEAVNNAVRHAAPKRIEIALAAAGDAITLEVTDDGRGLPEDWEDSPGMGLKAMRHRAQMIDGSLSVGRRPGGGTLVRCSFHRRQSGPQMSGLDVRRGSRA